MRGQSSLEMERVHLARKFVSIEGGARHYYEEEIFDNYDAAHSFIQNISEEDEDFFLSEIVSCKLNDTYSKYDKEVHIFNKNGVLIWSNNSPHSSSKKKFSGKFSVGDIVILQAFPWISSSPTHVSTIGVVAEVPIFFDEWITLGKEIKTWDGTYVVESIRDGYLGHWHATEESLELYCQDLPENLQFLKILSEHYMGEKAISSNILQDIKNGDIFVEKVKHFDFTRNK